VVDIRPALPVEIDAVLAVWADADAEPTVTDDRRGVEALLHHDPEALLVAEDERRVVGTVVVGWDGWRGAFYRLAVLPPWRHQGIATRLVREGERRLRDRGARRIAAIAVTSHGQAVGFWRAAGYEAQEDRTRLVKVLDA
jgi:ribosomal protein S18 acetylase RimI-like enzyme